MIEIYQHLPKFIDPIAFSIGSFDVRWYSLSYIAGFFIAYLVMLSAARKYKIQDTKHRIQNTIFDFLLLNFFAALVGGRLGYVLFYNLPYFIANPMATIFPLTDGRFVGIYGMSYHGALLAVLATSFIFLKIKKINFFTWSDAAAPAAALGYFLGRLGNFLNGELPGRITESKFGMYFLADPGNLRHPSQLYEAFGEGILLYLFLVNLNKFKLPEGSIFCFYLIGYGSVRFLLEFFREPDAQVGLLVGIFTLGQLLSFLMLMMGVLLLVKIRKTVDKKV